MPGLLAPLSLFNSRLPSHPPPYVHSFEPEYMLQRRVLRTKTMVSAFFPSQSLYHSSSSLIRYAWSLLLNHDAFLLCHLMQITPQVYVCSTTVQYILFEGTVPWGGFFTIGNFLQDSDLGWKFFLFGWKLTVFRWVLGLGKYARNPTENMLSEKGVYRSRTHSKNKPTPSLCYFSTKEPLHHHFR